MSDRDTYRSDQYRWKSAQRDDGEPRRGGSDYGWSSASEGRSFADSDAGAPYGARPGRAGGSGYGGQGAYGQRPGPGAYGYGGGTAGWDQDRSDDQPGRSDLDYDRGGQGGSGRYRSGTRSEWSPGGRFARPEGRFDDRGGEHRNWTRDADERRHDRHSERAEQAQHRVAASLPTDEHEHSYRRWRDAQLDAHDQDYARWRDQQARRYDDDYGQWRSQRHEAFSRDFEGWRLNRGPTDQPGDALTANGPEVENVADGRDPSEDRDT